MKSILCSSIFHMNKLFCIKLYRLRYSSSTNSSSQDSSSPNNSYLDSSYPETVHTQNSSYPEQFIPGTVHTLGQFIPWDSSYPENSYLEMNFQGMNCPGYELSWVWTVSGYELSQDMNCLYQKQIKNCSSNIALKK